MKLQDLIQVFKPEQTITIYNYDTKKDDFGEKVFFSGIVGDLAADEKKSAKLDGREVKAIERGLISLCIGIA